MSGGEEGGTQASAQPYDAVLLLSFGAPEGPEDVLPFLRNVTRGRGVPDERLAVVARQYDSVGGVSPLNQCNRDLVSSLSTELAQRGTPLPVYWGNRNWAPYVADVVAQMKTDGVRRAAVLVTSAYSSWSGCRQYLDDLAAARAAVGPGAPELDRVRPFFNHPGFVGPLGEATAAALDALPAELRDTAEVVAVAHSIPLSQAVGCDYLEQLQEVARLVGESGGVHREVRLAFCSRSGPPTQEWLGPDVSEVLREAAADGLRAAVLVPIGFVSEHMEVVFDLDVLAAATARECGLELRRAATPGTAAAFVEMAADLIGELTEPHRPQPVVGALGPRPVPCAPGCCPRG